MKGTPITGVITFIGSIPDSLGITDKKLQNNETAQPVNTVAGKTVKWLEVLNIILLICGTISPKKPIGPQ